MPCGRRVTADPLPFKLPKGSEKNVPVGAPDRPWFRGPLRSWLGGLLLGSRLRMIGNRLHLGFVDRLGARGIEGRACRHNPVFRRLGAAVAGAYFDTAGVDGLLGLAARQVRLRIEGALGGQVLALLARV